MREIKFRAWHKQFNVMFPVIGISFRYEEADPKLDFPLVEMDDGKVRFSSSDVILMQFTGLKDRNGKEIYEGDILKMYEGDILGHWSVAYSGNLQSGLGMECAGWYIQRDDFESFCFLECRNDYEVIGNIYENPGTIPTTNEIRR